MSPAITPPAPVLLSTSTCCPNSAVSRSASRRATMSVTPPGGKGTTRRIGFSGYSARAAVASESRMASTAARSLMDREYGRLRHPAIRLLRACETHLAAEQDQRFVDHMGTEVRGHAVHVL